jgi:hypothetical protein
MKNAHFKNILFLLIVVLTVSTCKKEETPPGSGSGEWTIPVDQVLSGGPGPDGIPSVDNPQFAKACEVTFLDDDDLVLGIKIGDIIRAYPHPILDWHEILNDNIDGDAIAITYCPLTGTGIAWDAKLNGQNTTFGVSGLLYNSNLMPYDRGSGSLWSQMRLDCVNGELIRKEIETMPLVEMTWKSWKAFYPDSDVVTTNTGFDRDYDDYPYGDYKTGNYVNFPISKEDNRLHKKERVLGVIVDDSVRAYRFDSFAEEKINVIYDELHGENLVIFGSQDENFIMAYKNELSDGTVLMDLSPVQDGGEIVAEDAEGNKLNLFGEVAEGPLKGQNLKGVSTYMGYWFSWGTFFNPSIYE